MQYRKDLINFFIEKFNYKNYLEIGVKSETKTFLYIQCLQKEGVDPNGCTTHKMTSDDFFKSIPVDKKWDIIFVDGYHEKTQVKKDIENAILHLNDNGTIVCHDVNPKEQWLLGEEFCWNAWEAFATLRATRPDLEMHGLTFDHLGYIRKGSQKVFDTPIQYTWEFLCKHRQELMQELTVEEIYQKYK